MGRRIKGGVGGWGGGPREGGWGRVREERVTGVRSWTQEVGVRRRKGARGGPGGRVLGGVGETVVDIQGGQRGREEPGSAGVGRDPGGGGERAADRSVSPISSSHYLSSMNGFWHQRQEQQRPPPARHTPPSLPFQNPPHSLSPSVLWGPSRPLGWGTKGGTGCKQGEG